MSKTARVLRIFALLLSLTLSNIAEIEELLKIWSSKKKDVKTFDFSI